jgi:membrane protein insertase Oxa1/YidC/SpoIIIJ
MEIGFPEGNFIAGAVYALVCAMYNNGAIGYAAAIICFVVVLRLIMLPLDFGNRYFTKKNSVAMAKMKPEIDEVKQRFAGNAVAIQRGTQEVYRKHGYKMGGFCLFSLLNIALTLMIFISVFSAMRGISNFNVNRQFIELQGVYLQYHEEWNTPARQLWFESEPKGDGARCTTEVPCDENDLCDWHTWIKEGFDEKWLELPQDFELTVGEWNGVDLAGKTFAEAMNFVFEETRVGFLWISNIFQPDTWSSKFLDINTFENAVRGVQGSVLSVADEFFTETKIGELRGIYQAEDLEAGTTRPYGYWDDPRVKSTYRERHVASIRAQYLVMFLPIAEEQTGWNGYLILVILAGVATFGSAWVSTRIMIPKADRKPINWTFWKKRKEDDVKVMTAEENAQYSMRKAKEEVEKKNKPPVDPAKMGKIMKIMLPIIMVWFTMTSTSALAIYIIMSSVLTTIFTIGMNYLVEWILKWENKRKERKNVEREDVVDTTIINPHAKYFGKPKK